MTNVPEAGGDTGWVEVPGMRLIFDASSSTQTRSRLYFTISLGSLRVGHQWWAKTRLAHLQFVKALVLSPSSG